MPLMTRSLITFYARRFDIHFHCHQHSFPSEGVKNERTLLWVQRLVGRKLYHHDLLS
jgi:hypothetical protein